MKVLGIIPARGGSKGIPNKNIKPLGGIPLIDYTIKSALVSTMLDKVVLSTDSEEIIHCAQKHSKIEVPFVRPETLAQDNTPTVDVVKHVVEFYEKNGQYFDFVCLLQPTSPFRSSDLIDKVISEVLRKEGDSLVTVRSVPDKFNPHWTFKCDENKFLKIATGDSKIIKRRQDLPEAFYRDGKIYITKTELVKAGSLIGSSLIGFINNNEIDVNIDTLDDWKEAEAVIENGEYKY